MAAFADSDDMIARFDARTLGDICANDDDVQVTPAGLAANKKMLAALNTATGKIISVCLRAKRYSRADLDALTGESLEFLIDITCRIAFWHLWKRKPYADDPVRKMAKEEYDEILADLSSGHAIFDVEAVKDAGVPHVETVTRVEVERDWNLFVDAARGSFYPQRRTYKHR